jgi:hypothetical protein
MNKIFCTSLLTLICLSYVECLPQTADTITAIAKRNAKNFKLDDITWKVTRQQKPAETSDYFKPDKIYVKDTTLLRDSAYVTAFRHYAYKQNKRRRTAGHHILVGVEIAAGLAVVALIAIIIFIAPHQG